MLHYSQLSIKPLNTQQPVDARKKKLQSEKDGLENVCVFEMLPYHAQWGQRFWSRILTTTIGLVALFSCSYIFNGYAFILPTKIMMLHYKSIQKEKLNVI